MIEALYFYSFFTPIWHVICYDRERLSRPRYAIALADPSIGFICERGPYVYTANAKEMNGAVPKSRESLQMDSDAVPRVQVQYFGAIRAAAHKPEEAVDFAPDATVYQLLQRLTGIYDDEFRGEIFEESGERLRDDLMLTLNGTVIEHASAAEIHLRPGDALGLFPIFPGGG